MSQALNTEITLLGGLTVSRDGAPLALPPSRKTRALLAYLVVTQRAHRRERLCDVFWDIPDDPRGALRWSLSKLRKIIDEPGAARIQADRTNVAFDSTGVTIDLCTVRNELADGVETVSTETLAELAAKFDGEFLEGLELPDCPDFQSWCVAEREDARILHVRILRALVERLEATPESALPHARALARIDPLNEWATGTLQRLLIETGRCGPKAIPAEDGTPAPESTGSASESSIAVLPFANLSEDRALEYMAEGLTADIISLLARIPGFVVISRSSTFAYRSRKPDVRDIGRELGVRYVVEGSLRPVGHSLRVSVQLTDADTGSYLWAERFDRSADDMLDVQEIMTNGIVARLAPELARAELTQIKRRVPGDIDAWSHYKQAIGGLTVGGWHQDNFNSALKQLRRAIALDPDFALAHALLSLLLAVGKLLGLSFASEKAHDESLAAAETALALDGQSSDVLGFAGCALADLGYPDRGKPLLERAIANDPSNAQAWVALGTVLIGTGEFDLGVAKLRHGIRIGPADSRLAFWKAVLASGLFRLGRLDEALAQARDACRQDHNVAYSQLTFAVMAAAAGTTQEAAAALGEARRIQPNLTAADIQRMVGRKGMKALKKAGLLNGAPTGACPADM